MSKNRGSRKKRWGKHEDHRAPGAIVRRPRMRDDELISAEELEETAAELLEEEPR